MTVKPFAALRPNPLFVSDLNVPPYDVVDAEEVRRSVQAHEHSFFKITRAEVDLPGVDEHSAPVYQKARENLLSFIDKGWLFRENKPSYYILSQTWQGRTQTGLYAAVSCQEYISGQIKKHELTRKDKEEDRTSHIETSRAGTGPVFLAFDRTPDFTALIAPYITREPVYHFSDENEVDNKLWVIDNDDTLLALEEYFKTIPALYIADGHHRAASAVNVYRRRLEKGTPTAGESSFMAVLFPMDELKILPYNRAVTDLNGLKPSEFLESLKKSFRLEKTDSLDSKGKDDIRLYLDGSSYRLSPLDGKVDKKNPVRSLDVSILQELVLSPILGIDDPRTSKRIRFVGGIKGSAELRRLVDCGEMAAAFALYPVSMGELKAVVDQGEIMPPKSTWFEPKLRDGLVTYLLD